MWLVWFLGVPIVASAGALTRANVQARSRPGGRIGRLLRDGADTKGRPPAGMMNRKAADLADELGTTFGDACACMMDQSPACLSRPEVEAARRRTPQHVWQSPMGWSGACGCD